MKIVSNQVALRVLEEVYNKLEKKEDGTQKVFVQTKFSAPPLKGGPKLKIFQ